ncbi:hypothetical protein [Pantoea sp.]|uniref:hypothetical protein n=1 Tax=Pantoea sp. TaxID=69393 RepID=UPI0028A63AB3|nr:hypothetical protein [Pantoea sp.]
MNNYLLSPCIIMLRPGLYPDARINYYQVNKVNYKQFQNKIESWEKISFTSIIYSQYGADFEVYAIDEHSNTKSRIFLCYAENEAEAQRLVDQYSVWLAKFNSLARKRLSSEQAMKSALLQQE